MNPLYLLAQAAPDAPDPITAAISEITGISVAVIQGTLVVILIATPFVYLKLGIAILRKL